MHCTQCGTAVPDGAAFCPKCGAATGSAPSATVAAAPPQPAAAPPKKSRTIGCLALIGAIVLLVILVQMFAPRSAEGPGAAGKDGKAAPAELPLAVSATELFNGFQANEASAQSYFGNRKLLVSGTVDKVMLDLFDHPVVLLRTPNMFMSAHASLADDARPEAGKFSPGDKVKLLCEDISEVAATPMLKDCRTAPADAKGQPIQWADKKK
jgi:hypothetical protein